MENEEKGLEILDAVTNEDIKSLIYTIRGNGRYCEKNNYLK